MTLSATAVVLACLVVFAGGAIQGSIGFGLSLVAAPFLVLIDPTLVPVPINVVSLVFNLLVVGRERGEPHWQAVSWPLIGLVPGSALGAAALAWLSDQREALTVVLSGLVLVAVGLSVAGLHPRRRPGTLLGVGASAGFMNTTVGIGGPPVALAFQDARGPELRGVLSRFFLASQIASLLLLGVWGQVHVTDLWAGLAMVPGALVGFAVSGRLIPHVDRGRLRTGVLVLSAVAAVVAIARVLV